MMERLLDNINSPEDLKKIPEEKLSGLAQELRGEIIKVVSKKGGHLAPSLGVVELTIALHYVFNAPVDKIIWDVGHQSYAHKLVTGRRERFHMLRCLGGISGFPNRFESIYDVFTCGHSSTSISTALGIASARDIKKEDYKVIAVIGDAALGGGMAFEALNHAGHLNKDLIVVLNDNRMSISHPVGAMSKYLTRVITNPIYNRIRDDIEMLIKRIPKLGKRLTKTAKRLEEALKNLLVPGILFEELGFRYFGPVDGHDIDMLVDTFKNIRTLNEPLLVHVITKKGKGYEFAEKSPDKFHGTGSFDIKTGNSFKKGLAISATEAFGQALLELGKEDEKIIAVTAAMPEGTGLDKFAKDFPDRFFDVGIAEQHAVCFGAGLASGGLKPVVAIYSTFLQRGFDQIIHDMCLQNLGVVLAIDRAGVVGEDGPTHHGTFDLTYLRALPNMVVMAPKDNFELKEMLRFAVNFGHPIAMRYPRGRLFIEPSLWKGACKPIELGKSEILKEGKDIAILTVGSMVNTSLSAAKILSEKNRHALVVNARFVKPLDEKLIMDLAKRCKYLVTVEENVLRGGFGSAVLELIKEKGLNVNVKCLGLPDKFIEHGKREELLAMHGLNAESIADKILKWVTG